MREKAIKENYLELLAFKYIRIKVVFTLNFNPKIPSNSTMNHAPPRKSIQRVDNRKGKAPRLSIKELMSLNESNDFTPGNQSRRKSYYLPQQSPAERSAYQASTVEGFSPTMRGTTPKGLSMMKIDSSETKSVKGQHRGSEFSTPMGTEIFDDNKEVQKLCKD